MPVRIGVLKENHQAVPSSFVDVSPSAQDLVEKGAEVPLDDGVDRLHRELRTHLRVARHVGEHDREIHLALLEEIRRVGRFLDQVLHRMAVPASRRLFLMNLVMKRTPSW